MEISNGIKILHSTSDILGIVQDKNRIDLTLYGSTDLEGEIVFEGSNMNSIKSVKIEDTLLKLIHANNRITINYSHKAKSQFKLTIDIIE